MASNSEINYRILLALKKQQFFNKIGLGAIRLIKKRIRSGKDIKGSTFQPYSDNYVLVKSRAGFANPEKVNLTLARVGGMLAAIDHKSVGEDTVEVYFTDPLKEQLAYYHNVSGAGKSKVLREFFGLNEEEEDTLTELAQSEAEKILVKEIGGLFMELNEKI